MNHLEGRSEFESRDTKKLATVILIIFFININNNILFNNRKYGEFCIARIKHLFGSSTSLIYLQYAIVLEQ